MFFDRSGVAAKGLSVALLLFFGAYAAATDLSTTPLSTYSQGSSEPVHPNILFVLDDSGSMDWDFMPDWACATPYSTQVTDCNSAGQDPSSARSEYLFRNASYNGVYYNPAVKYTAPIAIDANGATNTSTYPSMTGADAGTGADTATKPNWNAVKDDAYGVQNRPNLSATNTTNLGSDAARPPLYYTTIAGEYCDSASLKNCTASSTATGAYTFPAPLRWCNSSALTTCQAAFSSSYSYARAPSPRTATITVPLFSGTVTISDISVGTYKILPATVSGSSSTLAAAIAAGINLCNGTAVSNCTTAGFAATVSGNIVTITASTVASLATPVLTSATTTSSWTTAFSTNAVPGFTVLTVVVPGTAANYAYPGGTAKASTRTDCAGTKCTGNEEMTNYANWWTYYRTRMQMMKTAGSNAFSAIDTAADVAALKSNYRLGFMTINNNTRADFVNLDDFAGTQKYNWYTKLLGANPGSSTPLRAALSKAGRLYAGKLTTLNGVAVTDPLQYSCQQNYTILSTDGFWNESSGYKKLDGSTDVGNQDASQAAPYGDGGTSTQQISTSTLQTSTKTISRRGNISYGTPSNATTTCTESPNTPSTSGTHCSYTAWTSWSNGACIAAPQSAGPTYTQLTAVQCQNASTNGTSNTLADVAAYYYNTDLRTATPVTTADTTGSCTGALGLDVCADNVPSNGRDVAKTQHMTTFTLGLGSQGQMIYAPQKDNDYWKDTSGDFYDVFKRSTANTSTGVCSWQSSGLCYWPVPSSNSNANIDDLWHAAINGHGTYFSAKDPSSLASGLTNVLTQIANTPRPGTAAAAASSNPNVTSSDNFVFSSAYESVQWTGELYRQRINADGTLTAANWYAGRLLDCSTTAWAASTVYAADSVYRNGTGCYRVRTAYTSGTTFDGTSTGVDFLNTDVVHADEAASSLVPVVAKTSRSIFTNSSTALIPFTLTDLTTASLNGSFTESYLTSRLSQFCSNDPSCLSSANKTSASNANLINYLRGDRTYENTYYPARNHILGDIVASEAKYVKAPLSNYSDTGFATYKAAQASRNGAVYVGANDGMLHAFEASSGQELWAYIPSQLLPNLYQLADKKYASQHQYFVDGTPEIGEIYGPCRPVTTLRPTTCTGNEWRTILVGGLNRGGTGYYALDVTDPADPIYLWQFTDSNMGYTYGNPKITKLKNGNWVVLLSSGYNNSDGKGYLYVVNAIAGTAVRTIATGSVGEIGHINARALSPDTDNTSVAAYGGDTAGNLWRFDINGDIGASGYDAQKLVNLQDANGKAQPMTAQPELATVNGLTMVYVGTGKYLGVTDISSTDSQSFYGVVDRSDTVTLPTPRSTGSKFVNQTLTESTCPANAPASLCTQGQTVRTSSTIPTPVDWTINNGWYVDFPGSGERAATDPSLVLGSVVFTTIMPSLPSSNPCGVASNTGGKSFLYSLDYTTGGAVKGSNGVVGMSLGDILATRPVPIELPDGTIVTLTRGTPPSGSSNVPDATVSQPPINYNNGNGLRRVSWRELTGQ